MLLIIGLILLPTSSRSFSAGDDDVEEWDGGAELAMGNEPSSNATSREIYTG
jgi:hypothetical protein